MATEGDLSTPSLAESNGLPDRESGILPLEEQTRGGSPQFQNALSTLKNANRRKNMKLNLTMLLVILISICVVPVIVIIVMIAVFA